MEFLVGKQMFVYGVLEVFIGNRMTENDIPMEDGYIDGFWGEFQDFSITPSSWSKYREIS